MATRFLSPTNGPDADAPAPASPPPLPLWRALLLGSLLIPLNALWVTLVEVRWNTLDGTSLPLFITPIFFLFVLVLLNLLWRKVSPHPQAALRQEELLLEIGDHCWIGERVWLDTFFPIAIGSHVCISQGAYLCTGNHDWSDTAFGLIDGSLVIEDGAWVGARATILPGAHIASHAVIAGGAVLSKPTEPYTVYAGNPAQPIKKRVIRQIL